MVNVHEKMPPAAREFFCLSDFAAPGPQDANDFYTGNQTLFIKLLKSLAHGRPNRGIRCIVTKIPAKNV